ncbi:MAG: hypothetical protein RIE73_21990 [Coleofasciculus sp. C1-SOL-03]|jgi:NAD kinase|uniref:hypothetical protein n=1 Tax=Coleofasciculus sp. C1-SOL-03 TaxID=3069522 RepID=UPI0032FA9574
MQLKTFSIYAKNPEKGQQVKDQVENQGFDYAETNPDFMITVGGDGTYLEAERIKPGIPKLLVKDSLICFKCHNEPLDEMLAMIQAGKSQFKEIIKLEVIHNQGRLLAVNDIILRNENPIHAIRFKVSVNQEDVDPTVIGDGVVVATPFGATGYYRSVTRSTFNQGIGVAFNNPTQEKPPLLLDETDELSLEITREVGQLVADNNPTIVTVNPGDKIMIRQASEVGRLVYHNNQ